MKYSVILIVLALVFVLAGCDSASYCDDLLAQQRDAFSCDAEAEDNCQIALANPDVSFGWRLRLDVEPAGVMMEDQERMDRFQCAVDALDEQGLTYEANWDSYRLDITAPYADMQPALLWTMFGEPLVSCSDTDFCNCTVRSVEDCKDLPDCTYVNGQVIDLENDCASTIEPIACTYAAACDYTALAEGPDGDCWRIFSCTGGLPEGYSEDAGVCGDYEPEQDIAACE